MIGAVLGTGTTETAYRRRRGQRRAAAEAAGRAGALRLRLAGLLPPLPGD